MADVKITYYKENLPLLIEELKKAVKQALEVIGRGIDEDLTGDKYVNVLRAKRQASEDVIWNLKKIDELENEVNGVEEVIEEVVSSNPAKRFAQKG